VAQPLLLVLLQQLTVGQEAPAPQWRKASNSRTISAISPTVYEK